LERPEQTELSSSLIRASFRNPSPLIQAGERAVLSIEGKRVGGLSLKKNFIKTFPTKGGKVRVAIENGTARVSDSSCRGRICCSSHPVALAGERIICAPNRFLLEIEGPRFLDTVIG